MASLWANLILFSGIALLVLAISGMTVLLRSRRVPGKPTAWLVAATFLAAVAMILLGIRPRAELDRRRLEPERADSAAALARQRRGGELLARHVADRFGEGQTIGLVYSADTARSAGESAMLEGFIAGLAGKCLVVHSPLPGGDADGNSDEIWPGAESYDLAFASCGKVEAIVTLAGLPPRLSRMKFWGTDSPPPLVIANAQFMLLRKLIASGRIEAALARRPWLPGEPMPEGDAEWLVITTANLAEAAVRYRTIFAPDSPPMPGI